jgi:hypothetical protein
MNAMCQHILSTNNPRLDTTSTSKFESGNLHLFEIGQPRLAARQARSSQHNCKHGAEIVDSGKGYKITMP